MGGIYLLTELGGGLLYGSPRTEHAIFNRLAGGVLDGKVVAYLSWDGIIGMGKMGRRFIFCLSYEDPNDPKTQENTYDTDQTPFYKSLAHCCHRNRFFDLRECPFESDKQCKKHAQKMSFRKFSIYFKQLRKV